MTPKKAFEGGLTIFNAIWKVVSIACTLVSASFLLLWAAGVEAARVMGESVSEIGAKLWLLVWGHSYLAIFVVLLIALFVVFYFKTLRTRRLIRACLFAGGPNSRWRAWIDCLRLTALLKRPPSPRQARIFVESRLIVRELWAANWPIAEAEGAEAAAAERTAIIEALQARLRPGDDAPVVQIDNCPSLIEQRAEIEAYLTYIVKHGWAKQSRTICKVHIGDGFFAPIFLVAGLVEAFQENWAPIIGAFDPLVRKYANPISRDFEAFRQFQFNCWLLWGPSIPVCTCGQWSDYTAYQFGFGDENNSIDVLMAVTPNSTARIQKIMQSGRKDRSVAATSARVEGQLMLPDLIRDRLGKAQRALLCDIINDEEPKRIALVVDNPQEDLKGSASEDIENFYYSAYIWVMFVICKSDGTPLHAGDTDRNGRPESRWRNLIPFFVHGNIADESTFIHHKKMLARQVCETIKDVLTTNPTVSLAFACAFDEPGCDGEVLWRSDGRSKSLRNLILGAIAEDQGLQAFVTDARLKMDPLSGYMPHDHAYASCLLPGVVLKYYQELKAKGWSGVAQVT